MIYLSKQIKFKKESETINTIIKDKEIEDKKKIIKSLMKTHLSVNNNLVDSKQKYEEIKSQYKQKYTELVSKEKIAKDLLLKTIIRKYRLEAIEREEIRHFFANSIKNYLKTWVISSKYIFFERIGGIRNYGIAKKRMLRLQTLLSIKPERTSIVMKKRIKIWIRNKIYQSVMLSVKKMKVCQSSNSKYKLEIYSTTAPYFQLELTITEEQYQNKICVKDQQDQQDQKDKKKYKKNELFYIYTDIKNKKIMFLDQYLSVVANAVKIKKMYNVFLFQIEVLKNKKNNEDFKCLTINNIFQSVYSVPGYLNLSLRVLICIKKQQRKVQNSGFLKYENNLSNSELIFHKNYQEQKYLHYCFYCEPIEPYDKKFMFCIKDDSILKGFQNNLKQFVPFFLKNYMIQLNVKKLKKKNDKNDNNENNENQEGRSSKIKKQTQLFVQKPRIVSVIDFESKIQKIIKVQSILRMNLKRRKLIEQLRCLKKSLTFQFKCKIIGNIMISAFINKQEVIFIVECLSLSAEKRKKPTDQFLHYKKKYWKLVLPFINSFQFLSIIKKYLIWEIEDDIDYYFQETIRKFEEEEEKINEMRPIKALNRLRRFFVRSCLKIKIHKNIFHVEKIQKQFGVLVLIIRKCCLLKNIVNVYLYLLKANQKQNELKIGINKPQRNKVSCKLIEKNEKKSCQYQSMSMFLQNALAFVKVNQQFSDRRIKKSNQINGKFVENQFYITEKYFLLKPLHLQNIRGIYKFLERLSFVSLCSEEILTEINNLNYARNYKESAESEFKKTMTISQSVPKITKKFSSSIIFDKVDQEQALQQEDENLIFYSIYKDAKGLFYLELFLIISAQSNQYFKSVHREEISKREIASSSLLFIYKLIAQWVKSSGWCINNEQKVKINGGKQFPGQYHQTSNKVVVENVIQPEENLQDS